MWKAQQLLGSHCEQMRALRKEFDCAPLVIHTSYLVNLCSQTALFREKSLIAFRGEVERALALGAEYLVLHPGSWKGLTRSEGLRLAAESIARAVDGVRFDDCDFRVLIENTAGEEIEQLKKVVPVGSCLDTCHCHVAGYDLVTEAGYEQTVQWISGTMGVDAVRAWHMNDAKAPRGSKLDRHQHIGQGTMGLEPFRRLLDDKRFAHCAFIAETPVDEEGDERRNVETMKSLIRVQGAERGAQKGRVSA